MNNLLISVTLHILLLLIFLTIFYWLVISKTESKALNKELINSINSIPYQTEIDSSTKTFLLNLYSSEDITRDKNNYILLLLNIVLIVALFIILVLEIYLSGPKVNLKNILIENLWILLLVGGIEYTFFKTIAANYVPVKPSYMTDIIAEKIKNI